MIDNDTYLDYGDINPEPVIFARMGIDKITLGIDNKLLKCKQSPDYLKGVIDIITYGNYSELNFHGEYIDIYYPLRSIANMMCFYGNHIFRDDISNIIMDYANNLLYDVYPYSDFIFLLFEDGIFKIDEYEIFFDLYGDNLPFEIMDRSIFFDMNGTLYSKDYRELQRKVKLPNGKTKYESKGKIRSIFCLYDRSRHIDKPFPITRLEIRICDRKAKVILEPCDLLLPLPHFIMKNGYKIREKIRKAPLPETAIVFNSDFISQNIPYLQWIFSCEYQPSITCEKKTIFNL
jgi:hypothetical protein